MVSIPKQKSVPLTSRCPSRNSFGRPDGTIGIRPSAQYAGPACGAVIRPALARNMAGRNGYSTNRRSDRSDSNPLDTARRNQVKRKSEGDASNATDECVRRVSRTALPENRTPNPMT